jgi:hypothetical protein
MQFHKIQLIGQHDLPTGQDWALVEHDEQITLFIKEHALTPHSLEEAWAAIRLLTSPRHPRPRVIQPRMASPLLNTA